MLTSEPTHPALQILFVSGLTLIIGPHKTFYFFARKQKLRGTLCFLGGILLVFAKWPFTGMVIETFGFLNLFGCVVSLPLHPRRPAVLTPSTCPPVFLFLSHIGMLSPPT